MDNVTQHSATSFAFGQFRYDALRRELCDSSGPVRIGSRSLQLLEVFLESPGRLYSREELVSRVWPRTVVEDTSLRVHVSALRRLLGDGQNGAKYITNVPGRGYALVCEVRAVASAPAPLVQPGPFPIARRKLPVRLTRHIGRGQEILKVGELLCQQRLVSIVGTGGLGKTTVALAAAENLSPLHAQGSFFVDLSTLTDAALVIVELGQSCGVDMARGEPWETLQQALEHQQALIVLDNCEHVIDAAATLADRLLRTCPQIRILATSREPLEVEAEWVFRLQPLGLPAPGDSPDIHGMLSYPSIQLFVDRARASSNVFQLTEANVTAVRQLCEFLDGIPLAIELAAARVNSLGERGLLLRLESVFELLTQGRRTATSRHQTLHAVLNWSYELLTEAEKVVLQRLAVFRSTFELEGAIAVGSCPELPREQVIESVLSLCQKSLVMRDDADDGVARHRLLYVTRLFAERALASRADAATVHHRHANFVLACMLDANRLQAALPNFRSSLARPSVIADLRTAVTWALHEENDLVLGMEIVAESLFMYVAASLVDESRRQMIVAIDKIGRARVEGTLLEFKLQRSLTLISSQSLTDRDAKARAAARTRELAAQFGSPVDKIEALYAMCTSAYGEGHYLQALACCEEIRELAQGPLSDLSIAVGDRLAVLTLHALAQHDAAERLAYRVMEFNDRNLEWRFQSAVPFAVAMRTQLSRIHWLRGDFQQAWATLHEAILQESSAHVYTICQPLAMAAIPLAIWKGDIATATRWCGELHNHATRASLPYWQAFANAYGGLIEGRPLLPGSIEVQSLAKSLPLMDIYATLQPGPPNPATLARVREGEVGWCAPEVLRLAALAVFNPASDASRRRCIAELRKAHDLSVEQGARFWSLRIGISLFEVAPEGSTERSSSKAQLLALMNSIDDGSMQPDLLQARRLVTSS